MSKILEFVSSKKRSSKNSNIIESGDLGELTYSVYKHGNLHITDEKNNLIFKKNCDLFENEIDKLNLNRMKEGEVKEIKGCGDNDTLVFECVNGDIKISLKSPEYSTFKKLKNMLKKK